MNIPCILVIDDEPDNFDVIETYLSEQNYRLHYTADGPEAIASLDTFAPDLILLDVMMPGMDGLEVCQKIKTFSRWRFTPIIMVTALNEKEDLARCLETGADDFIGKPIDRSELRARVRSTLRLKEQYDQIQEFSRLQRDTINILGRNLAELSENIVHHFPRELNIPLHGMIGTIDLLKTNLEDLEPATVREMLDWLDRSARRLESLTQKFQVYLEIELLANRQGEREPVRGWISPPILTEKLTLMAKNYHREEDLVCEIEEAEIALPDEYLAILFLELVDNALKCSLPRTIVTVSARVRGETLHISVHDSGCGMTGEQIAHLDSFRPFDRDANERQGGGMGLKIVKKMVGLLLGKFSISSVHQWETTVNITLPIARDSEYSGRQE